MFEWFFEAQQPDGSWMILAVGGEPGVVATFEGYKHRKPRNPIRVRNGELTVHEWDYSSLWREETCICGGKFIETPVTGRILCGKCKRRW